MEKSKETTITLMVAAILATMILLFPAATTITPFQQAYSLSRYVVGADNPNPAASGANGKIYQPLEQEPGNIPKTPSVPCAMDNIESLESFLSCLGAK